MTTRCIRADVAFPMPCDLGEGALWDQHTGRLHWVDIAQHKVFTYDPGNGSNLAFDVQESVGAVVLTQNGKLLLALRTGFACLDPATGKLAYLADPEAHLAGTRFNDGKCDPRGRFWAGTLVEGGPKGIGGLYCLGTDLTVTKHLDGVTNSNGLVWTRDARTFYYIDTAMQRVDAFDFDAAAGTIAGRRVAAAIAPELGSPDGMAIDRDDHLWIALFRGGKVIRIDPASGAVEFEVALPVSNVTSCAFGGTDLDELYVTTARIGLSPEQLRAQPLAGSLFRAKVPFRGVPTPRFGAAL